MATTSLVIDADTQVEIIQCLIEKLNTCYIFPDVAAQISDRLQKYHADGEYSTNTDGDLLALALTMHMQEVSHDEHLWIRYHVEPLPDAPGPLRQNREWQYEQEQKATLDNYGLHRVERLPGNIGYIDIHYFHRPEWGGDTAVAAMNFLANTGALIIDLRNCSGGYPGMIALIISYLFGDEPLLLDIIYWRDDDVTQQFWTQPCVPGKRFGDKPVYVLTSKETFSGGEEFAYILQTRQRAVLVGERTDGGAHPGASYRLNPHFEAFIPVGRVINPITGTDWEGVGVSPEIAAPHEQALKIAYRLALQSILEGLGETQSGPIKALKEEAQAALRGLENNSIIRSIHG